MFRAYSMVVILKVGGLAAAADCIRAHIAHDARPWKLVHVSTLNQARLALARERVDLLLIHHQLPDGDALSAELPVAGVLQLVSIDPGFESVASQALDQGFTDYVVEATHDGFGAVMLAQISSALRHRETTRTLHRQHGLLSAISRAQASFIQTNDNRAAFNSLLTDLLALTHSAYGFVGEVFYDSPEAPWLQVHALTNLAWDEASRKAYADADGPGMAFRKLDTLFGSALRTGEPVLTNAPAADPRAGAPLKVTRLCWRFWVYRLGQRASCWPWWAWPTGPVATACTRLTCCGRCWTPLARWWWPGAWRRSAPRRYMC